MEDFSEQELQDIFDELVGLKKSNYNEEAAVTLTSIIDFMTVKQDPIVAKHAFLSIINDLVNKLKRLQMKLCLAAFALKHWNNMVQEKILSAEVKEEDLAPKKKLPKTE